MKLSEVAGPDPSSKPMKLSDLTKDLGEADYTPAAAMAGAEGDPNLSLGDIGEVAQGVVKGALGGPGALEQGLLNLTGHGDEETLFPTPTDIGEDFGFDQPSNERASGYETLGEVISPGLYSAAGKLAKAAKGLTAGARVAGLGEDIASGRLGQDILSAPRGAAEAERTQQGETLAGERQALQQAQRQKRGLGEQSTIIDKTVSGRDAAGRIDPSARGEEIQTEIKRVADKLASQRKNAADQAYAEADATMAAKQGVQPWQEHPSGRGFLDDLEKRISTPNETSETAATRGELQRIHDDLLGVAKPEGGTAYSQPTVIREVLRKLRDAASGHPETGYEAIGQQRAGSLADELARSISKWEPSLKKADDLYKKLSEKLRPTLTRRGKAALKREKFDYTKLAGDPQSLPGLFFKSEQGIDQLTELVGGDTAKVDKFAMDHALDELRDKSPAQAEAWLSSQRAWLNNDTLPTVYGRLKTLIDTAKTAGGRAETATGQAQGAAKRALSIRDTIRSGSGEAAKSLKSAEDKVAALERDVKEGTVPPKDVVQGVRSLLKSVPHDSATAQRLNKRLDSIEKAAERGKIYRRVGAGAVGVLGGGALGRSLGIFGSH